MNEQPARSEPRTEWLNRALIEHERVMLERDSNLVAGKFAKMAKTPFSFFRGTAWLGPQDASPFKTAASSQIAILGDPHPENVGTVADSRGVRHLEFNDFDLAGFGSYLDDLRRLATGLWIVTDMGKMKRKHQVAVVGQVVDGYVAEVGALSRGERPFSLTEDILPGALDSILADADDHLDTGQPPSKAEQELVRELLKAYPPSLGALPEAARKAMPQRSMKDMLSIKRVVRVHTGVSSYPLLRFQVVVEGPTTGAPDDWVLELKESIGDPASRLVAIQRQFHEVAEGDAFVGWATVGGREFRVRRVESNQRRIDADRLAKRLKKDDLSTKDLGNFAVGLGRLLARGHCRALDRAGKAGLPSIAQAIGDARGLQGETVAYAERLAATSDKDLGILRELLSSKGTTLGWRPATKR